MRLLILSIFFLFLSLLVLSEHLLDRVLTADIIVVKLIVFLDDDYLAVCIIGVVRLLELCILILYALLYLLLPPGPVLQRKCLLYSN